MANRPYISYIIDRLRARPGSTAEEVHAAIPEEIRPSVSTIRRYLNTEVSIVNTNESPTAVPKRFALLEYEETDSGPEKYPVQSQTREEFEDHAVAEDAQGNKLDLPYAPVSTAGWPENFSMAEQHTEMAAHGFEVPRQRTFDRVIHKVHEFDMMVNENQGERVTQTRGNPEVISGGAHGPAHGSKVQVRQKPRKSRGGRGNDGHSGKRSPGDNRGQWFRHPRSERSNRIVP